MKRVTNIIEALEDRRLFGALPAFRDLKTWARWLVFLRALYGLPMSAEQECVYCYHTGRSRYVARDGGYREAAAITGRQAGKDRIGSVVQVYEAITAKPEPDGTELYSVSIAQDARSALRTAHRYARAPFERIPALRELVGTKNTDAWTLTNNVVLAGYPCRPAALRGIRAKFVVGTEWAFFRSGENLPIDVEMLRAVRPTLATTGGRLLILSSPYSSSGALYELHRRHFGRDDSDVLIWVATAPEMNPTLASDYLLRMQESDPEGYRSEVLGEFREGWGTLYDAEALQACVMPGVREIEKPTRGSRRAVVIDAASGSGKDEFTVSASEHVQGVTTQLASRAWKPPFNPTGVFAEIAEFCRRFGETTVHSDRYAPGFVQEQLRIHNLAWRALEMDRSELYLNLLPLINSGVVRLLDEPEMLKQFRGLERKRGTSGRDKVDHAPGQHDDRCNCAAAALVVAHQSAHRGPSVAGISVAEVECLQRRNRGRLSEELECDRQEDEERIRAGTQEKFLKAQLGQGHLDALDRVGRPWLKR